MSDYRNRIARRPREVLASVPILAGAFGLAWGIGSRRERRAASAQVDRLMRAAAAAPPRDPPPQEFEALPPPVARYLRLVLPEPKPITAVRISQTGALRTGIRSDRWMTFAAEHVAAPQAIGFVWNARVSIAPLLHVRVRDAYEQGRGSGHVALLSAIPVGADAGTPAMNAGALHRFLAEAVWYPTALLPGPHLRWSPIDASRALAAVTDQGVTVSLEFRFAQSGEATGIYTPARWGRFAGGYEQRPWEGHFRNYALRDGILVPLEGDVGWYADGQWHPVWTGNIKRFATIAARDAQAGSDFAPPPA